MIDLGIRANKEKYIVSWNEILSAPPYRQCIGVVWYVTITNTNNLRIGMPKDDPNCSRNIGK
jgi:hypothetical protein